MKKRYGDHDTNEEMLAAYRERVKILVPQLCNEIITKETINAQRSKETKHC